MNNKIVENWVNQQWDIINKKEIKCSRNLIINTSEENLKLLSKLFNNYKITKENDTIYSSKLQSL